MKLISIGLVLAALSTGAFAQTPLATHDCTKPPLPDATKKILAAEANAFVRILETFRNCVLAFSESQKQIAATKQKEAESRGTRSLDSGRSSCRSG